MELEPAKQFLVSSRFWVQRVLVPILVFIGVGGNVVTVMVLTRRRMRCSTNIYLTALAVADLVYLLFVLVLSFEHYPNISNFRYELYWRFYGINHWLADAASSTSIWLVVCFTIERYIAVCHPIRGKVLCTENRAKRVIAAVSILCILATVSTSLEYQLTTSPYCEQQECPVTPMNHYKSNFVNDFHNHTISDVIEIQNDEPKLDNNTEFYLKNCVNDTGQLCNTNTVECQTKNEELITLCRNETKNDTLKDCCVEGKTIKVEQTNLGKNETYKTIFYWFTSISFTFLPLMLIATFNCFLVNVVRKSQKQRKQMTKSQENNSQAQENRMTLILIAVVVLFLICQTPTACMLIYTSMYPKLDGPTEDLVKGLGNVFNLLVSINAACNFLLYCALSDKYRRTFLALICRRGGPGATWLESTASTLSRSYRSRGASGTSGRQPASSASQNGFRRNVSAYVPRNYERYLHKKVIRAYGYVQRESRLPVSHLPAENCSTSACQSGTTTGTTRFPLLPLPE